jgi:hypothetical protein
MVTVACACAPAATIEATAVAMHPRIVDLIVVSINQ